MKNLLNGNIILGDSLNTSLNVFNPDNGSQVFSFSDHGSDVSAIACLPNGNIVIGGWRSDSMLRIFNPTDGTLLSRIPQHGEVNAIMVLANGNFIVGSNKSNGTLRVIDPNDGSVVKSFSQQQRRVSTPEQLKACMRFIERKEMEKNYQVLGLAQLRNGFFSLPSELIRRIVLLTGEAFHDESHKSNKRLKRG